MAKLWIIATIVLGTLTALGSSAGSEKSSDDDPYPIWNSCFERLQQQINEELFASLTYLNMAAHFQRNDVARKGFYRFFLDQSDEEKKHAHKLIHYMNKRGGQVKAFAVEMPSKFEWSSALEAVTSAVELEADLNKKLHLIHKNAETVCHDPHLMDFLESEFLEEQISSMNSLKKLATTLRSFEPTNRALGEYHVDLQLLNEKKDSKRKYFEEEL